jgi:uncharacterized membrane protein
MNDTLKRTTLRLGRTLYALGMVGIGGQHYFNGDFVTVIVPTYPAWLGGRYFWTCVAGMGLIVTGIAIIIGKGARAAAILLGAVLLALVVLWDVPHQAAANPGSLGAWTLCLKALALSGGAFIAAASVPGQGSAAWDRPFVAFGGFAVAAAVAVFGVDHVVYAGFVQALVPPWIPWHLFWTYVCGAALFAAGAGIILRIRARLAAGLLGAMILVWVPVLHIPRALADPHGGNGNEWTGVFEATSFAGTAFMLALMLPRRRATAKAPAPVGVQRAGS